MAKPLIEFREYQKPVFLDRETGILVIFWSRQIGKSFTLAGWAVDRLLTSPGRLVTVLSNSKDNGAEFALKCVEIGQKLKIAKEDLEFEGCDDVVDFEEMKYEIRIKVKGKVGRIKVLAASPRTARGFSGDLIIDEFAFHEDGAAIWDAAEPILSSNPDFLCRIASTGNGTNNMFYRMVTEGKYKVNLVRRSDAWKMG
ncbi:MAG: terminase family protein, partial [Kiritimatiellae bacterium]|nr:terminase family protein [Kiritimatiellia bacterium]